MAESFAERRRRELGLSGSSPSSPSTSDSSGSSFVERRKMELGLTPNTMKDSINARGAAETDESRLVNQSRESLIPVTSAPQADNKIHIPVLDFLNNNILEPAGNFLNRAATSAMDALTLGQGKKQLINHPDNLVTPTLQESLRPADTTSEKVADVIGNLYGSAAPMMGGYATGGKLAAGAFSKLSPKVISAIDNVGRLNGIGNASKFVGMGARGLGAGLAYEGTKGALDYAIDPQGKTMDERLKEAALGAAMFAGGDAALGAIGPVLGMAGKYAGTKLGQALDKWRGSRAPKVEQQASDVLALPNGQGEASQFPRVNSSSDPISTPYTFKLPQASDATITHNNNISDAFNALREIDNHLGSLDSQYKQTINDQYKLLKSQLNDRGGVTQGQLISDANGNVTGRVGRISNNPQWYQEFYAEHGKVPSNKELYNLAKKHVDEGYSDNGVNIPSWLQENDYHNTHQSLNSVRDEIKNSIKENGLNLTDAQLKDQVLKGVSKPQNISATLKQEPVQTVAFPRSAPSESVQSRPVQVTPVRPVNQPMQQRGFTDTLLESDKAPQGLKDRLKSAYTPITNETSVLQANKRVDKDLESAASFVMGKSPTSAEKVTTAHRLIDEFSKRGNFERANDIADKVAEELTKAGQSVQAASIYNRLTPEGILVHAQRIAKRVNESLPITAKEVKVTPDIAAKLMDLTQTTRQMTGVKDLSHDVLNILDRAKSGEKLSASDTEALKKFVNESKQFIQETKPKANANKPPRAPQQPKGKRVRDNVVSFLDAQEQAAKDRLRAKGIRISSTPLDIWADYAIIGAAKMAKGTIKLADWSEQMVKDLGEEIRPHLRNLYDRSVEAFEQSTKKVTAQTISNAEKVTNKFVNDALEGKLIDQAKAESLRSLAQNVSRLSGQEKSAASQDLQAILQELHRPGVLKKVSSVQTIGQLLNPKTQVRNVLGNELFYRLERLNKTLATPIDIVRSKITGGDRTVTFKTNNQGEFWRNWLSGLKAGWKGVDINGLQTQYGLAGQTFKSKYNPLTYMEKALGASLKSFDNAAYMRAYNNTLGEMATLRAINEGKTESKDLIQKYIREADDNVMKIADEYGRYVTFQDNNAISNTLVKAKRVMNLGKDFGVGDLVLKYPKTPGALLMRALEYSPAGFVRSAAILARPIFKGEANTAEVTQALTRAIIGTTGLSGLGFFLLDNGILTGSASKDKDVRDLQKSAGQGQYQVNLSALFRLVKSGFNPDASKLNENDLLYTYDWMQPVSVAVSMGANVAKNMSEGKQKLSGLAGTAYNSIEGGLGTLTEQSVLSGIKNAVQGYPGQTVTDKITDILSSVPSSFVPTYLNQAKQLTDNVKRETYSPNKVEQSLNLAKAKVPGLAGKLPQQYDTLGQPKETYQDNNAGNVLLNPGFASRYKLSPEAKMIVDLMDESGDDSVAPRVPVKTITLDGQKVKLNGDQLSRLEQLQGTETAKQLNKKYNGTASLEKRVNTVQNLLTDAGKQARTQLVKEFPELKPPKATR